MKRPWILLQLSCVLLGCRTSEPAAPIAPPAAPAPTVSASAPAELLGADRVRALYDKREVLVPMRDGVKLFTAIYTPRSQSRAFPILLRRTPYSCRPYGPDAFPSMPGPSDLFTGAGYGFAIQDVRGAYMSEGEFVDVRPHDADKRTVQEIDESTDTWDTIEWLVKNVPGNSGSVGMWGISYPGFYAAAGMIDAHPALKAVSPQAPIADWWWDDFHHNGALFLPHSFLFLAGFGVPRPVPVREHGGRFDARTPDGYDFFSRAGVAELGREHLKGEVRFWNDLMAHPDYDEFWKARDLLPHLNRVAPAVMTVGGLFDAEDLYGPLAIHRAVEQRNPAIQNTLVMGPWVHGGWSRTDGDALGQARFGAKTGVFYREQVEKPFFDRFLLGGPDPKLPEALVFDTGRNAWGRFDAWPPATLRRQVLSLGAQGSLALAEAAPGSEAVARFTSDPSKPVPHTQAIVLGMNKEYMTEDQRFAARRPDVATFQTEPLTEDVTLAGPLQVHLRVSTDGTDADWIVKLVDVFPDGAEDPQDLPLAPGQRMGGYHMLVRGDVMPGRFRRGHDKALPSEPGVVDDVPFTLWDVLHTFQKGHRIQVQVQSTWFPLVARNPQVFRENPGEATVGEMRVAQHAIHAGSRIEVGILPSN
ncbi:MAG: CocE/NonD family hydrolase [Planctomycetota bacterium]|nr:CocE/NonD family hydrolase [Planctomycetota bacterium]